MPELEKWLAIPDCHVPYHDKRAFRLMLKAADGCKIRNAVVLGDFCDFYAVSSHEKDPNRSADLAWEVEQAKSARRLIDRVCWDQKVFVAGNHEDRLTRYLQNKAPELFNTISIPEILGLNSEGWRYVPYKSHAKIGKLYVTHDIGTAGRYSHYKLGEAFQGNCIQGHTHRLGWAVEGSAKGKAHVMAQLGWLGDIEKVDYMHKVRAMRDWAQGFGVIYVEPNGNVHVVPVAIVDGKCVLEGQLFRA